MQVVYSAVKRFDPACGDNWTKFIAWSGLTQLRELVSLDGILCPTVFQELTAEDWQHNVQEDSVPANSLGWYRRVDGMTQAPFGEWL